MTVAAPLRAVKQLSIMPTLRCTAACAHCGTYSSPKIKTTLTRSALLKAIDEAAEIKYAAVVFTGGEPLLEWDLTVDGIRRAAELGLRTRIVSNGFWARTEERGKKAVHALVDAGLDELNLSTGDEHAKYVPLDSVVRAVTAAIDATLPCVIMVEVRKDPKITAQTLTQHPVLASLLKNRSHAFSISQSPWMSLDPVESSNIEGQALVNRSNIAKRKGCDSVLRDTTVYSDGKVLACCGIGAKSIAELNLGRFPESSLSSLDRKSRDDFLKRWLRVDGPEKILAWAATFDPSIKWENMY